MEQTSSVIGNSKKKRKIQTIEEYLSDARQNWSERKKSLRFPVQHVKYHWKKRKQDNTMKGSIYLLEKNYKEAIKYFNKELHHNSSNLVSLFNKASALMELEKWNEALVVFQRVLELSENPSFKADVYNNIGHIMNSQGKLENSLEYFKKVIEIDSQHIEGINNAANILYSLGRFSEAEKYFRMALKISPNDSNSLYDLGNTLQSLFRYEEADECYSKAIEISPNDIRYQYNKASGLFSLGKYKEALQLCLDIL